MALIPFNSVGGYSTGITGTTVIDADGNITGVGATFSGLARFTSGISAAGATLGLTRVVGACAAGYMEFYQTSQTNYINSNLPLFIKNDSNGSWIWLQDDLYLQNGTGTIRIGDGDGQNNVTHIAINDQLASISLQNAFGEILIGDADLQDSGNYIFYRADEHVIDGNAAYITNFSEISANYAIFENGRRVTTNARSWFL